MRCAVLILSVTLAAFSSALAQTEPPKPSELLVKADSALRSLNSVSYRAEEYTLETLQLGDQVAIVAPVQGEVTIVKIAEADPIGARLFVSGALGSFDSGNHFQLTYDGKRIRKLDPSRKVVYVNEPDETGRQLLALGPTELILDAFKSPEPLSKEHQASRLRYDGQALVAGVLCNAVWVEYPDTTSRSRAWWFFGAEDYLPRKVVRLYDNREGEEHANTLTLYDLKVNVPLDASAFEMEAPENYTVKVFEGLGKKTPALAVGAVAPAWTLRDPQGREHALDDYRGQLIVLDFWATWCGPCLAAMPELQRLHERYEEEGVRILGISTWESEDPVELMKSRNYSYQLLLDGDEVARAYGVIGLPTVYVVGPDGKVLYGEIGSGPDSYEKVEQVIENSLAGE